jgi:hypothetical protein
MNSPQNLTKYNIYIGEKREGFLLNQKIAGFSLLFEGNNYYVMRLMMLPHTWYYLMKNRDSQANYTVYAKCIRGPDGDVIKFQDPVGSAELIDDLKTHLELKFPLFATSVFMNLFPSMKKES